MAGVKWLPDWRPIRYRWQGPQGRSSHRPEETRSAAGGFLGRPHLRIPPQRGRNIARKGKSRPHQAPGSPWVVMPLSWNPQRERNSNLCPIPCWHGWSSS